MVLLENQDYISRSLSLVPITQCFHLLTHGSFPLLLLLLYLIQLFHWIGD